MIMDLSVTRHCLERFQSRSIPPFVASLVQEYGRSVRRGEADVIFLDKASRRRLRQELGCRIYNSIEQFLDAYVVCSDDGRLITAAWRTKRIRRP